MSEQRETSLSRRGGNAILANSPLRSVQAGTLSDRRFNRTIDSDHDSRAYSHRRVVVQCEVASLPIVPVAPPLRGGLSGFSNGSGPLLSGHLT